MFSFNYCEHFIAQNGTGTRYFYLEIFVFLECVGCRRGNGFCQRIYTFFIIMRQGDQMMPAVFHERGNALIDCIDESHAPMSFRQHRLNFLYI